MFYISLIFVSAESSDSFFEEFMLAFNAGLSKASCKNAVLRNFLA